MSACLVPALFLVCFTIATAQLTSFNCDKGFFFDGTRCRECPAGTYQDEGRADTCKKCPPGTFSELPGMVGLDLCLPCPAGTFLTKQGNPSEANCIKCPPGQSSVPGSISCTRCNPGTFLIARRDRLEWNRRRPTCRKCPMNTFSAMPNAKKCTACPISLVSTEEKTICTKCKPGFRLTIENLPGRRCVKCNSFKVGDGTTPCLQCPPGFFNSQSVGASTCRPCPPGTTSSQNGSKCEKCPPGSVRGTASPFCLPLDTPCPENYFLNAANACQTCNKSERFDERTNKCVPCGRNMESKGGLSQICEKCPSDRVSGRNGCVCKPGLAIGEDGSCFRCPAGQIWDGDFCTECTGRFEIVTPGSLSCSECPPGTVPTFPGTRCETCPKGTRPSMNIGFNVDLPGRCVDVTTGCPPGFLRNLLDGNLLDCDPASCPPGTVEELRDFGLFNRTRICHNCLRGEFFKRVRCKSCRRNAVSPGGLVNSCQRCPRRMKAAPEDQSRCACLSRFSESRGIVNGICEQCPKGMFGFSRGELGCRKCPSGLVSLRRGAVGCKVCPIGSVANKNQTGCEECVSGTTSFGVGETTCVAIGSLKNRK